MGRHSTRLDNINKALRNLELKRSLVIDQALQSDNPTDIIKANTFVQQIRQRDESSRKSYMVDPSEFNRAFQYKDRNISVSYGMLRAMAKTPIINAVIKTRVNQIAAFAEPAKDNHSMGYKIQRKLIPGMDKNNKLSKEEEIEIYSIIQFIEDTGVNNEWGNDDFDTFVRKFVKDSLTFDQATFEVVRDRKGMPIEFFATDSSTFRVSKSYDDTDYERNYNRNKTDQIRGYYPSHVQIYNNKVINEYYPWELCFGIRNPTTTIFNQGYGISELEEIVSLVTALLWGEEYNRNFFKQGSVPKGIFKVQGGMNDTNVQQFRQQWNAMMKGVSNSWKTPFLEAEKIDYIDLQKNNKDMEFSNWIEFLIKVSSAIFAIDPAEINFPLQGGANENSMFKGNNEARLKQSKDKGLYPLLKFLQKRLNKYIVKNFYNGKYEIVFTGMDSISKDELLEAETKQVKTYKTVNEIREEKGMKPLEGGDILLDSVFANQMAQASMNEEEIEDFSEEDENPFVEKAEDNPFHTALFDYFEEKQLI